MDIIERYLPYKVLLFLCVSLLVLFGVVFSFTNFDNRKESVLDCPTITEEKEETSIAKIKVDIKGYVKKPGVYELVDTAIVNDLIKLAGGIKSGGTTDNINLSKILKNEDVVVILSKKELKEQNTKPISSTTFENRTDLSEQQSSGVLPSDAAPKKVSLNQATKEELMTLSGIGESKALLIIEYRKKTPFQNITDIMNVSGIGESIYEKIKDNITI